jgi:hypothetical protein
MRPVDPGTTGALLVTGAGVVVGVVGAGVAAPGVGAGRGAGTRGPQAVRLAAASTMTKRERDMRWCW